MKKIVRKNGRIGPTTPFTSIASASENPNVNGTMNAAKMTIVRKDLRNSRSCKMSE